MVVVALVLAGGPSMWGYSYWSTPVSEPEPERIAI